MTANNANARVSHEEAVEMVAAAISPQGKMYRDDAATVLSSKLHALPDGTYWKDSVVDLCQTIKR